ncbi:ABC transporter substrate-binding protein [Paenibacillus sp. NPDC057967]|uniref:ABC transporter substrate-binding protein n=1 Tax=Paenibacillus sp. NPDC057967 TaxID=3346293 RepID=UPI0036DD5B7D
MTYWCKKLSLLLVVCVMFTGCSLGGKEQETSDPVTLKVLYYSEEEFYRNYGMLFSTLYPEIEFEVISLQRIYNSNEEDPVKAKQELIEKEKPDLLLIDLYDLETLTEKGKLLSLDTYLARDKINTDEMVPGIIDMMKEIGDGQQYGMPSSFSGRVLYYNKGLFDAHNIPYPSDQMTWSEVIQLAERFPADGEPTDRIYGIKLGYSGKLNEISDMIMSSEGLKYVNEATRQITVNTPAWQEAVELAKKLTDSDTFYRQDQQSSPMSMTYQSYLKQNPFLANRVAMLLDQSYLLRELEEISKLGGDNGDLIKEWDMVTVPVGEQNRDSSNGFFLSEVFAIMKDSPNPEAAWKLISFVADEEHTRLKSKLGFGRGLPIHTKYIRDDAGHHFEAFYKLKPSFNKKAAVENRLPDSFYNEFYWMKDEELQAVQDGSKGLEEALESLQARGEALLARTDASGDGSKPTEEVTETELPAEGLEPSDAPSEGEDLAADEEA